MNTTNVVLTNVFEIYIIEIEKYKERAEQEELDTWVKFLKNPEVITMNEKNKQLEIAKKLKEMNMSLSDIEKATGLISKELKDL